MWEALSSALKPGGAPLNTVFVLDSVQSEVLQWSHASQLACQPGLHCTLYLLRQHFWWTSMVQDSQAFIAACVICARGKSMHQPLAGPLYSILYQSCGSRGSHFAVDFITGLPPSGGQTVILTVVDCFSKAAHFVPLPKLPSAVETGDLLVQHLFHIHGNPQDVLSDRGPQFASQVSRGESEPLFRVSSSVQ